MPVLLRRLSPLVVVASLSIAGCLPPVEDATNRNSELESKANEQQAQAEPSSEPVAAPAAATEGFQRTASGLQYKIVKPGSSKKPTARDTVLCHYRGTLTDGTEFDSSYKRNEPISFPLNGVIAGWTEGLQLIGEGGEIQLIIPSELGYGTRGAPPTIPPNATLHFKVELLKVQ